MSKRFQWPVPVRILHWSIASFFLANHFIVEGGEQWHEYFGWSILTLVSLRLLYGITLAANQPD